MDISKQEQILFDKWCKIRPSLVRDGIIDQKSYFDSSPRILFILKEVNDRTDKGGWDLRSFVRDGARSQTWNNVTRWVKAIQNINKEIPWKELEHISEIDRKNTLRSIAVMNMKKIPGGHTTNTNELYKIANEDKALLKKQYSFYNPDLIICCGTAHVFKEAIMDSNEMQWQMTKRGVKFTELNSKQFLIDFSHPAARCPSSFMHYSIYDTVKEILAK